MNYFDGFEPERLQVGEIVLQRLGFGRHAYLQHLLRSLEESPLEERVDILCQALTLHVEVDLTGLSLADLKALATGVSRLNAPKGQMAWETAAPSDRQDRTTDYEGRWVARVVDVLARHYSWSHNEILNLPPETAMAHLQECLLQEHSQRRWEHSLSEVAWSYDKDAKVSRYRPLPDLEWDSIVQKARTPMPRHIIEKYYPQGVIIDLERQQRGVERPTSGASDNKAPG